MTWSTTNSKSSRTYNHVVPSSTAMRSPLMRASYSVTLFEAKKWRWIAYQSLLPSEEIRTSLAPKLGTMTDLSKYIVQYLWVTSRVRSWTSAHLAIKLARA